MPAGINDIVRVTATIAEQGLLRRVFGIGLFLTKDTTVGTGSQGIRVFIGPDDIDNFFPDNSEPQVAGNVWFSQSPTPENLYVGRHIVADTNALLFGTTPSALSAFTAISDGSFQMNGEDITGLDFSSATSLADVATVLQTALQAATDANLTNATVTYNVLRRRFDIDNQVSGAGSTLTVASAAASGTDISSIVGWAGATIYQGAVAESVTEALTRLRNLNSDWYFVMLDRNFTDAEKQEVADWVEPREYMAFLEDYNLATLVTGENSSQFASFFIDQVGRTVGDWTPSTDPYLAVSSAARLSSINFNQTNSLINPAFKSRPSITPAPFDVLGPTERVELDRKRINYFVEFRGDATYQTGTVFKNGVWQDVRYWLDWFVDAVRVEVYNLLRQSPRVPQSDIGYVTIQNAITTVCRQGVNNGGIASGQLSPALTLDVQQSTGDPDFDGFLPDGYLVYYTDPALQSQADRNARMSTPFRVWLKGSGAINNIDIQIVFEN